MVASQKYLGISTMYDSIYGYTENMEYNKKKQFILKDLQVSLNEISFMEFGEPYFDSTGLIITVPAISGPYLCHSGYRTMSYKRIAREGRLFSGFTDHDRIAINTAATHVYNEVLQFFDYLIYVDHINYKNVIPDCSTWSKMYAIRLLKET